MKRTYFLRGLGIGIIVTSLILTVSDRIEDKKSRLTNDEITTKAAVLGMVWPEVSKKPEESVEPSIMPDGEAKDSMNKEKKPEDSVKPNESSTPTQSPESVQSEEPTKSPEPTQTAKPPIASETKAPLESVENKGHKSISIINGMGSESVARVLEKEGLVEDAKDFNDFLKENGYATYISVGTYEFEEGVTYQQIADRITRR